MSTQSFSLQDAVKLARESAREGLSKLRHAAQIFGQINQQVRSPDIQLELWEIERRLNPDWIFASQHGQDRYLRENHFPDLNNGCFVDIGAYDGTTGSNTLFFERLGWTGLCIEASPTQFRKLATSRSTKSVHCAVADRESREKFLDIKQGYTQMGGLLSDLNDRQLSESSPTNQSVEVEVAVRPLSSLLSEHNLNHVDYCSIDVEGGEFRVLHGIDFEKHSFSVLSVENSKHYEDGPGVVAGFLEEKGFELVATIGYDEIFLSRVR